MVLITRYLPKFLLMVTQPSPPSSAVRPQLTISLSMGGNRPEGMDYILLVLPREADMSNSLVPSKGRVTEPCQEGPAPGMASSVHGCLLEQSVLLKPPHF